MERSVPNLLEPVAATRTTFVASPSLDFFNAMYFTSLAAQLEAVGEWPTQTRERMDPALRQELDFLFSYPRQEPGIMGALNDILFVHPETWGGVDDLLRFVRELRAEGDGGPEQPSIQSLAIYALRWPGHLRYTRPPRRSLRQALATEIREGRQHRPLLLRHALRPASGRGTARPLRPPRGDPRAHPGPDPALLR